MIIDLEECRAKRHIGKEKLEKIIKYNTRLPEDKVEITMYGNDALIVVDNPASRNFLESHGTRHKVVLGWGDELVLERELAVPQKYFVFDPTFFPEQHIAVVSSRVQHIKAVHDGIIESLCGKVSASSRFSASYTFMGPAGYETRVPFSQPNKPSYRNVLGFGAEGLEEKFEPDFQHIARNYITTIKRVLAKQLERIPRDEDVGVLFSGGIDSTTVLVLLHQLFEEHGRDAGKLKAFSLAINGGGSDRPQSEQVLALLKRAGIAVERHLYDFSTEGMDMEAYLKEQIRVVEDYKPANIQGIMGVGLALREIRKRHADVRYMFSGNGADEIGLSYSLNDPESRYRPLTFEEVMKKPLIFVFGPHEPGGRVFNPHKGGAGLSREACYYTYVNEAQGFVGLSPFLDREVLEFAAQIPYAALIPYEKSMENFKVELETAGLNEVAGVSLPVFHKTRLQSGIARENPFGFVNIHLTRKLYREMFD